MRHFFQITTCLLFLSLSFAYGFNQQQLSDKDCNEILKKMSLKISSNKSLQSGFVQERHLVMFGDTLRSEGYFYYQDPGRIRWEFIKPYASLTILLEQGDIGKYDFLDGRFVKVESGAKEVLSEVLTQIVNWQKGDFSSTNEDFEMSLYKNDGYTLVIKPFSKALAEIISHIEFEIQMESFLVNSVSIWEDENNYTVIRFINQKIDEKIPDDLFDLKNPKVVKYNKQ